MQPTLQRCSAAAFALAAAGITAATAVMAPPSLPDVQAPNVELSSAAGDALTAVGPYPIETWAEVLPAAWANLAGLAHEIATSPSFLGEVLTNWIAYTQTLWAADLESWTTLLTGLLGLPAVLKEALGALSSGAIPDAVGLLWNYASFDLGTNIFNPFLFNGLEPVLSSIGANAASVLAFNPTVGFIPAVNALDDIVASPVYGVGSGAAAFAGTAEDIYTALSNGDWAQAISDLINAPATIVGGFLNGYAALSYPPGVVFHFTPFGFLTYAGGPNGPEGMIQLLLDANNILANAITPFTDPAGSPNSLAGIEAVPPDLTTALVSAVAELDLGGLPADVAGFVGALPAELAGFSSALSAEIAGSLLSIF